MITEEKGEGKAQQRRRERGGECQVAQEGEQKSEPENDGERD
jgi:hypothetical protein